MRYNYLLRYVDCDVISSMLITVFLGNDMYAAGESVHLVYLSQLK